MKNKLRELTDRNNGMSNQLREEKYQQFVRGWVNYFKLADMKELLRRTDEWARRRIRVVYWKQWKKIKDIADAQKCQLRSDILAIYYRHCDEEEPTMREYERKNLDALYAAYEVLHGNTFVKDIYEDQMRHWKVTR